MTMPSATATAPPAGDEQPILSLRAVNKSFGAVHVLQDVDFDVYPGQVNALVGDNGAGKSTLIKGVAGSHLFDSGQYLFEGHPVTVHSPKDANALGIEVVYQDLALCDNLTAAENVFLGREAKRKFGPFNLIHYSAMFREAARHFAELKSETRPRDLVRQMSGGQRQAVAIARTRLSNPDIVLMDEPTAAISVRQVAEVLDLIRRLRDQNIAVILISHRMPDVFAVCDHVSVMRRGKVVADKPIKQTSPEEVTGLITGAIETA